VQGHESRYVPTSVCYHHHSSTSKNLPKEMLRLLQIRNPLLACVKNYDDKNLALVLGPALALALRRIRIVADLDDDKPFRIEAASSHSLGGPKGILDLARRKLEDHHVPYVTGKTWTTDGLYRETRGKLERRVAEGCLTVEMEAAAFFAVAAFRGATFGQLLYAGDDLSGDAWDNRGWDSHASGRELLFRIAAEACLSIPAD
jgi:hypothetical protein